MKDRAAIQWNRHKVQNWYRALDGAHLMWRHEDAYCRSSNDFPIAITCLRLFFTVCNRLEDGLQPVEATAQPTSTGGAHEERGTEKPGALHRARTPCDALYIFCHGFRLHPDGALAEKVVQHYHDGNLLRADGARPPMAVVHLLVKHLGEERPGKSMWFSAVTAEQYVEQMNCMVNWYRVAMAEVPHGYPLRLKRGGRWMRPGGKAPLERGPLRR